MCVARSQGDNIKVCIRRLYADQTFIFTISEVLHRSGFIDPWIPDNGRATAVFGNENFPLHPAVLDDAVGLRIKI